MKVTHHYLYNTWRQMRKRCNDPKHKDYKNYGARGIKVCNRWDNDFWTFVSDMGDRPKGHMIARIDNDKGYSPDNCRWATREQQNDQRTKCTNTTGVMRYTTPTEVSDVYLDLDTGKYLAKWQRQDIGLYDTIEKATEALETYKESKLMGEYRQLELFAELGLPAHL